jgi:glycogen operon protein
VELRRRGETDDHNVLTLRARQQRNFLATLFLSMGTPMLVGGDEMGRTQGGNNNAWCQDTRSPGSTGSLPDKHEDILGFTRRLIALRQKHPVFRRTRFLSGQEVEARGCPTSGGSAPTGAR